MPTGRVNDELFVEKRRWGTSQSVAPCSLGALLAWGLLSAGGLAACGTSSPATSATTTTAPAAAVESIIAAPIQVAHTALGAVGYREIGSGPPLVLITGFTASMEDWGPTFRR